MFEGGPSSGITAFDDSFPGKMWYHLHYTPTFDKPFPAVPHASLQLVILLAKHGV